MAVVVILFVGIYLAADPRPYRNGLIRLFPHQNRERVGQVLSETGATLHRWIVARLVLMALNGGLTTIGLWIFGIPLTLVLGLIAGLLNFVPNIGPFVAAAPAVLSGWVKGPEHALYVAGLYLFLQMLDGYVFTRHASVPNEQFERLVVNLTVGIPSPNLSVRPHIPAEHL